ncbi:MAG: type I-B CRISPR-associated protein Cas8b/Csh1 [Syntrophomonadaceae bacterium]|nr:type I-B CRISPR-associated protein Cas8b/Csh1 [Syntrophomonadaceae bacterium]
MLEAVAYLGNSLKGSQFIDNLVKDDIRSKKGESPYLVILNFNKTEDKWRLDLDAIQIPLQDPSARRGFLTRWCYVGNIMGSGPQIFVTTNTLNYLTGSSLANLRGFLEEKGLGDGELAQVLDELIGEVYAVVKAQTKAKTKAKTESEAGLEKPWLQKGAQVYLDPRRLGLANDDEYSKKVDEINKEFGKPADRSKEMAKWGAELIGKRLKEELVLGQEELSSQGKRKKGFSKSMIALWTIMVRGQPLVSFPEYEKAIIAYKMAGFESNEEGLCSLCGTHGKVSWEAFKKLVFYKPYITDKLGAAWGLKEREFNRSFALCEECFTNILVADQALPSAWSFGTGKVRFLLMPSLLVEEGKNELAGELSYQMKKMQRRVGGLVDLYTLGDVNEGLEANLQEVLDDTGAANLLLLNFLFYEKSQSEFRIYDLVKDVAPSYVSALIKTSMRIEGQTRDILGLAYPLRLDLKRIDELIPGRTNRKEHKNLLAVYSALLEGRPINRLFLAEQFVKMAFQQIHGGGRADSQIQQDKNAPRVMAERIIIANMLLRLLRENRLLVEVRRLPGRTIGLDERMERYLLEMEYGEPETAMFLMGYLLHQVAVGQRRSGHTRMPVLDKLNYQGMSFPKLIGLANQLFEKLRQYDRLGYNARYYAEMKRILDGNRRENWPLSPEENVFFILSGFSFGVMSGTKKEEGDGTDVDDQE